MSDPRYDPRFQRDGAEGSAVQPEPVASTDRPMDATRRRNPWLAVLWVVGAVLLALGIAPTVYWASIAGEGSYQLVVTGEQYLAITMVPMLLREIAPWFVVAGLAAFVGAVFVHAKDWRG